MFYCCILPFYSMCQYWIMFLIKSYFQSGYKVDDKTGFLFLCVRAQAVNVFSYIKIVHLYIHTCVYLMYASLILNPVWLSRARGFSRIEYAVYWFAHGFSVVDFFVIFFLPTFICRINRNNWWPDFNLFYLLCVVCVKRCELTENW